VISQVCAVHSWYVISPLFVYTFDGQSSVFLGCGILRNMSKRSPVTSTPDAKKASAEEPSPQEKKGPFMRGAKRALTLLLQPEMLERVDQAAEAMGQTRNGWISAAVARALREHERDWPVAASAARDAADRT
jgi:predicted transcriptional regulator